MNGRNERPLSDDSNFSAEDFAVKMEAGDFDGTINDEIRKLSREQVLEVANVSMKLRWANIDHALLTTTLTLAFSKQSERSKREFKKLGIL